jgi:heme/copper-type cytochrome/quinol oxidase subunit 2
MPKTKIRGLTTVEALLIAAAFIIVGVIGLLTFQGMGKAAAQALRANAIVTADRAGFDVTVEVLNGQLDGVILAYGESGQSLQRANRGYCILPNGEQTGTTDLKYKGQPLVAGQSITCRFDVEEQGLQPGKQYTYVVYAVDAQSGKIVQIAKGVVTVGIA